MYIWDQDIKKVNLEAFWDLDTFVRERLEDWLDLFEGIELVGRDMDN